MVSNVDSGNILKFFRKKKVMKIDDFVKLLKCSIPTVRRRLKEWKTYTSYNQNGRYYVLCSVPKFDQYGLWKYTNILFSKTGNLKETLVYIVDQSISGLSVSEISEVLRLPATNFLGHFKNDHSIQREKYNGIYIYFSRSPEIFEKQKTEREKIIHSTAKLNLPSDCDAVNIIVELIKHSQDSIEQLTHRVRKRGVKVSIEKIRNLLVYHNLLKKTQDFQSSEH